MSQHVQMHIGQKGGINRAERVQKKKKVRAKRGQIEGDGNST